MRIHLRDKKVMGIVVPNADAPKKEKNPEKVIDGGSREMSDRSQVLTIHSKIHAS